MLTVAVAALEAAVRLAHVPPYVLPTPSAVASTLFADRSELLVASGATAAAAGLGFVISTVLGIVLGILLASSRWLRRAFYPFTIFFQTVPIVAVAPLLVIWFDAGLVSVTISAVVVSIFPVIANTMTGMLSTDPALLDLFTLYQAGPVARLWKLRLPMATPAVFDGLRVAAGLAVVGTVVGEFLVGTLGEHEGLGVKIVGSIKQGHTDRVFAAVIVASLLGLVMFGIVNAASWLVLRRWHASEKT